MLPIDEASNTKLFETLLDITPRAALADKGYSSKRNFVLGSAPCITPVITHKSSEKNKLSFFSMTLYAQQERIEQGLGRLKRFNRVALRCEKTQRNYRSIVSCAAGLCLIKFVHTAWDKPLSGTSRAMRVMMMPPRTDCLPRNCRVNLNDLMALFSTSRACFRLPAIIWGTPMYIDVRYQRRTGLG